MATTITRSAPRGIILALLAALLGTLTLVGCGDDGNPGTVSPSAFVSPVDGKTYCAWVNNPHEDTSCLASGILAAPFPIPTSQPVRAPGMSDADWMLLGGLFGYGLGHHSYYFSPDYYDHYIGPAWSRYPGSYTGYGGRPVTRISSGNVYNTTIVNNVNGRYAARERVAEKTATYRTATGKIYTGSQVPAKLFSGDNAPVKAGGSAPVGTVPGNVSAPSGSTGRSGWGSTGSSTGKGGYSPSGSSSGRGSSGRGR